MSLRALTLAALAPLLAYAAGVSIRLEDGAFKASGLAVMTEPRSGWASVFAVFADGGDVPPMLGTYSVEGRSVVFRPRFPLAAGVRYRAVFEGTVEAFFDGPSLAVGPATKVQSVYPSSDVLPSNLLKFYVYFSAPMQRGGVWRHIHLLNESGQAVDLPFLEIDQELWDPENLRLTILFDPGRIKRGVTPERETGPAIVPGKRYTLVIGKEMADARGVPLVQGFRKEFRVGPALRTGIDIKQWKFSAPASGSRNPVIVDFSRPLDYALLQHVLTVRGVAGSAAIEANETRWRFMPKEPWRAGEHELIIDTALEDLAGNRMGRPFDVDVFERISERITTQTKSLKFHAR